MRKLKSTILGPRWLNIGGAGGADKTEVLVVVVLVIIIGGALALTVYTMFGGSGPPATGPQKFHYKCLNEECGYEWEALPPKVEIKPGQRDMMDGGDPRYNRVKCPKCGEMSGCQEVQCPKCKKWFVPESFRSGGRDMSPGVCPYCGTDLLKWSREHRKKKN